ncbi:MAG: DnaJ domain-containing protein [Akkermansiaceae bacterium]
MENYFKLLDIAQSTEIDLTQLSDHHKKLAAKHHPDSPGNDGNDTQYKLINTAYATLKSPSKRLTHLLELAGITYEKRGTVSDHLMDLFMSTAQLLQDTDQFLRKKSTTTSALGLALLEPESQLLQEKLGHQIDSIETEKSSTLEKATQIENLASPARDLAFLEKWQAELKERYASLF